MSDATLLAAMNSIGTTKSDLEAGIEQVKKLSKADEFQEAQKGESESAGEKKYEVLGTLDDQMTDFMAFAQIALRDDPQLMVALLKNVPTK